MGRRFPRAISGVYGTRLGVVASENNREPVRAYAGYQCARRNAALAVAQVFSMRF